jgi:hypothetical protein
LVALRGAAAPEAFCGVVMETVKLPFAPLTASCEGAGGEVNAAGVASIFSIGAVPVCA